MKKPTQPVDVLVVEDDENIRELIQYNLKKQNFSVHCLESGDYAIEFVKENKPRIILLDLMLPGMSGLEICNALKKNKDYSDIPIIMVSAKGDEADIVKGLELGADDYITKPFSPKVLIARVNTILKRHEIKTEEGRQDGQEVLTYKDLKIYIDKHTASIHNETLELTYSEFAALCLFAKKPGWVFTRNQIVDSIRGSDYPVTMRAVDVMIVTLRKKIGIENDYIQTVRGIGYRFKE